MVMFCIIAIIEKKNNSKRETAQHKRMEVTYVLFQWKL